MECRIYAEDPYNGFLPYPGKLTRLTRPLGPGIRLDGCVYEGWTVPMEYDPLLAKLAVWAGAREEAIARMARAIGEYRIDGIRTNLAFFGRLLRDPLFRQGRLDTGFIPAFLARSLPAAGDPEIEALAALVAAIEARSNQREPPSSSSGSRWRSEGREQLFR